MTSLLFWRDILTHKIETIDLFISSPITFVLPKMRHISPVINDRRTVFLLIAIFFYQYCTFSLTKASDISLYDLE